MEQEETAMSKVRLKIDDVEVETEAGRTILEAAAEAGVSIPTLCHDPRLEPFGACRLCLVEVGEGRPPVPACATPAVDGMVVRTRTEEIIRLRRTALELIASTHRGDCVAPCQLACPAGIDIQGFTAYIAEGRYRDAIQLIKEKLPLPAVCGRVCPRFCEDQCRRNVVDEPVAICALKRFVADRDLESGEPYEPEVGPDTGKRVAVVGGGPAGLSAAYYLARDGHGVTIFDSAPELGGMLRYGIPEYRLPKDVLDREIATISRLCSDVQCGSALGRDFTVSDLKARAFDAVLVAVGAHASRSLRIEGEDLDGVRDGIAFLRDVAMGRDARIGERTAVIGGGNTAMDAARTALRLGAREVTVYYRRSRGEMPANDEEIEQAEEEGIRFEYLVAPVGLIGESGAVKAMECIRMKLGEPDSSGRRRPEPVEGSEFTVPVDCVIAAIGQVMDTGSLEGSEEVGLTSRRYVEAEERTLQTSAEGVFAAGDCVSGPATVVEAAAAGRRAAVAISQYLAGEPVAGIEEPFNCTKGGPDEVDPEEYADRERIPRTQVAALPPGDRRSNFREIEGGFTEQQADRETERCLSCGCQDVFDCELRRLATEYGVRYGRLESFERNLTVRDDHGRIARDPYKCILCGRCVRTCAELHGVAALGFVNRGFDTKVEPSLGLPLDETLCDSCGQCAAACPTGALTVKVGLRKPGPWRTEKVATVCTGCGMGCGIVLETAAGAVVKASPIPGDPVSAGGICKHGSFDHDIVRHPGRVTQPLVRRNGRLEPATWEEALATAADGLRRVSHSCGGKAIALLASPTLTNEEAYLVQKLARVALGTNNLHSTGSSVPTPRSTAAFEDLDESDLVVLIGSDIEARHPIAAQRIRSAVRRGSRLVTVTARGNMLDSLARITIRVNRHTLPVLLRAILHHLFRYDLMDPAVSREDPEGLEALRRETEGCAIERAAYSARINPARAVEAALLYVRARRPVVVVDPAGIDADDLALVEGLAVATGNAGAPSGGVVYLERGANAVGLRAAGLAPDVLPGPRALSDASARERVSRLWGAPVPQEEGRSRTDMVSTIGEGDLKALVFLGDGRDLPGTLIDGGAFTVAAAPVLDERLSAADVVLPWAAPVETDGTLTNCEGRTRRLRRALPPVCGRTNLETLSALAGALGYEMTYAGFEDVLAELARTAGWDPVDPEEIDRTGSGWPLPARREERAYCSAT